MTGHTLAYKLHFSKGKREHACSFAPKSTRALDRELFSISSLRHTVDFTTQRHPAAVAAIVAKEEDEEVEFFMK